MLIDLFYGVRELAAYIHLKLQLIDTYRQTLQYNRRKIDIALSYPQSYLV